MRAVTLWIVGLGTLAWATGASAQVNEAQRAAARDLFKQGDELQRAGHFSEALDKFQRAEQAFTAPTNELRIAECQAALGRLVESAEAYRSVLRTVLSPASPPAFQAAIDQAKAELGQVEPRVPKLTVQVQPLVSTVQLQIDGQTVPSALLGEPIPLDPGPHKASAAAPGYAPSEQTVVLKEREMRVLQLALKLGAAAASPTEAPASAPPPALSAAGPTEALATSPRESRTSLLIGARIGLALAGGTLPADANVGSNTASIDFSEVAGGAFAFGLDAGVRLARRWYIGALLEHAVFASTSSPGTTVAGTALTVGHQSTADATLLELVLGFIGNPDRTSFYGEVGLGSRWFHYAVTGTASHPLYQSGEFSVGAGAWIPAGRSLRFLPKASLGLGGFDAAGKTYAHAFFMVGASGFYNLDL